MSTASRALPDIAATQANYLLPEGSVKEHLSKQNEKITLKPYQLWKRIINPRAKGLRLIVGKGEGRIY